MLPRQAVRERLGGDWHPSYLPLVQSFYHEAKRTGAPETYETLSADEIALREKTRIHMEKVRWQEFV